MGFQGIGEVPPLKPPYKYINPFHIKDINLKAFLEGRLVGFEKKT